jgi:hypothetical protein
MEKFHLPFAPNCVQKNSICRRQIQSAGCRIKIVGRRHDAASFHDQSSNPFGLSDHPSGQSSGSSGLTAGTFGVAASPFGASAKPFGRSCCSYIHTSGVFGLIASSFGLSAGSLGTVESSFFTIFDFF